MIDINIKKLLLTIRNESSNLPGVYERRLPTLSTLPVYIGVEIPTELYKFSFLFHQSFIEFLCDDGAEGFSVQIDKDPVNNDAAKFTIKLLNSKFADIFLILCTDLLNILAEPSVNEKTKLIKVNKRLDYWREFLRRPRNQRLSAEAEIGLIGELCFLKNILSINPNLDIMKYWGGPAGATHDFYGNSISVEVKTSTVKQRSYVKISSEFQLDSKEEDKLFLAHYEIREANDKSDVFNLLTLVRDIKELVDVSSCAALDGLLSLVGYVEADSHFYDKKRYELVKLTTYQVLDDFPRLIIDDLNLHVSDVQYRLNLIGLDKFLVSMDDVVNDFLGN